MRFLLLLLTITASVMTQATQVTNYQNELVYKNLNNMGVYIMSTDVTNKKKTLPFIVDLQSTETFVGIKKLTSNKTVSDFGIDACVAAEGCVLAANNATATTKKTYRGVQADVYTGGKLAIGLQKGKAVNPAKTADVTFFASNMTAWKFGGNGVLGLAPSSKFWSYIASAFSWKDNSIEVLFTTSIDASKGKTFSNNATSKGMITFGGVIKNDTLMGVTLSTGQSTWEIQASLALPQASTPTPKPTPAPTPSPTKILRRNRRVLAETVLIANTKFCIAPDHPGFIIAKQDSATLDKALWQHICKKDTPCTKDTDLSKVGHLVMDFGTQIGKKNISISDLTFKGTANLEKGWMTNAGLFAAGAPCASYSYAVGRNFFNERFGLILRTMVADVSKNNGWKIGLRYKAPSAVTAGGMSMMLKVGIGAILALVILIPILCYCMNRSKKRAELEESLDEVK